MYKKSPEDGLILRGFDNVFCISVFYSLVYYKLQIQLIATAVCGDVNDVEIVCLYYS